MERLLYLDDQGSTKCIFKVCYVENLNQDTKLLKHILKIQTLLGSLLKESGTDLGKT